MCALNTCSWGATPVSRIHTYKCREVCRSLHDLARWRKPFNEQQLRERARNCDLLSSGRQDIAQEWQRATNLPQGEHFTDEFIFMLERQLNSGAISVQVSQSINLHISGETSCLTQIWNKPMHLRDLIRGLGKLTEDMKGYQWLLVMLSLTCYLSRCYASDSQLLGRISGKELHAPVWFPGLSGGPPWETLG